MQKKILNFELDKNNLKMKDILDKEFVEIQVYAISDANPNRNHSHFTLDAMNAALPTFKNKPILGAWSIKGDDFKSHTGSLEYDSDLESIYWDYTQPGCETPLGTIRESDKIEIVFDEQRKENWIVVNAVLWSRYAYKPIKKLLRKNGKAKISVEIEVTKSHLDENNIEVIEEFNFTGLTILGKENGVEVEEGIENAHLSILDLMENQLFQRKCQALAFAYSALDKEVNKNLLDSQSNLSSNIKLIDDQSVKFSDEIISNENKEEVTMQSNKEKEEEVQMNQDDKDQETESCETCEKCSEENLVDDDKQQESCETCATEKCEVVDNDEQRDNDDEKSNYEDDDSNADEDKSDADKNDSTQKEEESCATCEKCSEDTNNFNESETDEPVSDYEKSEDVEKDSCGAKQEESCVSCEKCEADGPCDDDCGDDCGEKGEEFSQDENANSEDFSAISLNSEPARLDLEGKSMDQIINESTAAIKAPESGREVDQFGEATNKADSELQVFTPAVENAVEGQYESAIVSEVSAGPDGNKAKVVTQDSIKEEAKLEQPDDKAKEKIFSLVVDGEELDIEALYEKYTALKEQYDLLKHQVDLENVTKLITSAKEFIESDVNVPQSTKDDFVKQVSEKCESFELKEEEEIIRFAKSLLAMYYYDNLVKNNNTKDNNFSISIQKNSRVDNNASANKLRDAIEKLNKA